MANPYIGEIRPFAFGYNPKGWVLCDGRDMTISTNQALYSLLGTTFGGDGKTKFKVPDLRGRVVVGEGHGRNLTPRKRGEAFGVEGVTLNENQMPMHPHSLGGNAKAALKCKNDTANTPDPAGASVSLPQSGNVKKMYNTAAADTAMKNGSVEISGGTTENSGNNYAHSNMGSYLVINYCISTQGLYPQRS